MAATEKLMLSCAMQTFETSFHEDHVMAKTRNNKRGKQGGPEQDAAPPAKKATRKLRNQPPRRAHNAPASNPAAPESASASAALPQATAAEPANEQFRFILDDPVHRNVKTNLVRTIVKAPPKSDGKAAAKKDNSVVLGMRLGGKVTRLQQQVLDGYKDSWHVRTVRNGQLFQPHVCHTHQHVAANSTDPVLVSDAQVLRTYAARAAESRRALVPEQGPLPKYEVLGRSALPIRGAHTIKGPVYAPLCRSCFDLDRAPQSMRDAVDRMADPDLDDSDGVVYV